MGNKDSEFESQFYKRYSFIQSIDDKLFGLVKVYRKNTVKFDYIMILEVQLEHLIEQQIENLEKRLSQVRNYQNETTLRIYHYRLLDPHKIQCRNKRLLIYAEYINRSVYDYLCALRSNPKFVFEVNQIIYVLRNISKGCITLKKMNITHPDLNSSKIFLSPEGEALVCPLLYILSSLKSSNDYKQVNFLQNEYQKYSICLANSQYRNWFAIKPQLLNLLLEMTGNLSAQKLQQTNFLYRIIHDSPNIQALFVRLPEVDTETMRIQQMHSMQNMPGQFYDTN